MGNAGLGFWWSTAMRVVQRSWQARLRALAIGGMLTGVWLSACASSPMEEATTPQPPSHTESVATPVGSANLPSASDALAEEDAVSIARDAAPIAASGEVRSLQAGPLREVFPSRDLYDWSRNLPADRWVWMVFLVNTTALGDEDGAVVFIDYYDGTVYEVMEGIS